MSCERCSGTEDVRQFNPNLGKKPGKVVNLCRPCALKDDGLIPVEGDNLNVPTINPATEVDKFMAGGKIAVLSQSPEEAGKNISPPEIPETVPAQPPEVTSWGPPVDREAIQAKMDGYELDIKKLNEALGKKERECAQIRQIIVAKVGAKAGLENLLNDST